MTASACSTLSSLPSFLLANLALFSSIVSQFPFVYSPRLFYFGGFCLLVTSFFGCLNFWLSTPIFSFFPLFFSFIWTVWFAVCHFTWMYFIFDISQGAVTWGLDLVKDFRFASFFQVFSGCCFLTKLRADVFCSIFFCFFFKPHVCVQFHAICSPVSNHQTHSCHSLDLGSMLNQPWLQVSWVANPLQPQLSLFPTINYCYCYCFCLVFQQLSAVIFTEVIRWISLRQL